MCPASQRSGDRPTSALGPSGRATPGARPSRTATRSRSDGPPTGAGNPPSKAMESAMTTLEGLSIGAARSSAVTFLPEPEPRPREYTIVSVDDHLVEPPDTFEGRLPERFVEKGPR